MADRTGREAHGRDRGNHAGKGADTAALLAASVAGDSTAFARLVDEFANVVWSVVRAHRLDDAEAEDVFQLVFLRLFERQATIREPARLPGWLATTTRNECYAVHRRGRRSQAAGDLVDLEQGLDGAADHGATLELDHRLLADERQAAVAEALATLPGQCQDLLRVLSTDPPLSYDEIATVLDIPRGSIGPTRQRCLDKLRAHPRVRRISEASA